MSVIQITDLNDPQLDISLNVAAASAVAFWQLAKRK